MVTQEQFKDATAWVKLGQDQSSETLGKILDETLPNRPLVGTCTEPGTYQRFFVQHLMNIGKKVLRGSDPDFVTRAREAMLNHVISTYTASYIELAEEFKQTWLSFEADLQAGKDISSYCQ